MSRRLPPGLVVVRAGLLLSLAGCTLAGCTLAGCKEEPLVLDCLPGLTWDIDEQRCVGWDTGEEPVEPVVITEALPPGALLRRLSLDLRGTLPTVAELEAVEADPAVLDELRDQMLEDPAHEERLVDLFGERWQTLIDDFVIQEQDAGFDLDEEFLYERSVGEEPLRLLARVAVQDRPWTDILEVDWTMANEATLRMWPVELEEGEASELSEGAWARARYVDARPAAGVLSTNGLWWRYDTNDSNANRGRAAALSRLLVCADYHGRPVSFAEVDLSEGAESASSADPACTGCHAGLDPIAASLFGFYWVERYSMLEVSWYHAERELLGPEVLGLEPGWFGQPVDGLSSLALRIGEDPRFSRCQAQSMAEVLWRRPVELTDRARVDALDAAFVDADLRMHALLRAITDSPEYRAGALLDEASEADAERERTRRLVEASQLASVLEDLAGYRWEADGTELLREDEVGYRILAGGMDGRYVRVLSTEPTLTWTLVVQRLAELSAAHIVQTELSEGTAGDGELLAGVDLDQRPGDAAFDAALESLWWRLHGARAAEEDLSGLQGLWEAVDELEGPEAAWRATLTAMLRDPAWLEY